MTVSRDFLDSVLAGHEPTDEEALALSNNDDLSSLMNVAAQLRDRGHGKLISYSRKVFIPLTKLCRDSCHYCTFASPPGRMTSAYLSPEQVLEIARAGVRAGCKEALFTLGDKPELRYRAARAALERLGYATTHQYLAAMAKLVHEETGLLPHLNPGVMSADEIQSLRSVAVSLGIMLETAADRLSLKGGPHFGSPDKQPAVRLRSIRDAGVANVPFTSGLLIGIGESRRERIEALLALRALHDEHGHIQEIIIQNFKPKPGTRMAHVPEPDRSEHLWTIAVARIVFGPTMNIQAPPNLSSGPLVGLIAAGINDWGGVSPVTPDHVNPEAPWPEIEALATRTAEAGKLLVERLAIYPSYIHAADRWLDPSLRGPVLRACDSEGFARTDTWTSGSSLASPLRFPVASYDVRRSNPLEDILRRAAAGVGISEADVTTLFAARADDFSRVCEAADTLRQNVCGDRVTYTVNRNINYTNICYFRCKFCAFSKGKLSANLRGRPYDLALEEIQRRCLEAWDRGATEVCLQGGIHPSYTGETYLSICRAIKEVTPDMHIHAFSPLEVSQGAATLGMSVGPFLAKLKAAGLDTLPGTAAEILDDEVRAIICPDKLTTQQWMDVVEQAHELGLRTTATIMFGHVDRPVHWARHLLRIRALQERTGGFTEFVPLPFVPMETPIYLHGRSRSGPTFREAILMHAIARIALHPLISNIQASWVKMGPEGVKWCLRSGANDLGGTLMNESITRAAGATHGEEMPPVDMEELIRSIGRQPRQRTTLYRDPAVSQRVASFHAAPLQMPVMTAAH
jgi:FO synthase